MDKDDLAAAVELAAARETLNRLRRIVNLNRKQVTRIALASGESISMTFDAHGRLVFDAPCGTVFSTSIAIPVQEP